MMRTVGYVSISRRPPAAALSAEWRRGLRRARHQAQAWRGELDARPPRPQGCLGIAAGRLRASGAVRCSAHTFLSLQLTFLSLKLTFLSLQNPHSQWALAMQGRSETRTRPVWSAHTQHTGDYCRGLTAHSTLRDTRRDRLLCGPGQTRAVSE
jgi:hypothetical protein